MKPPAPISNPQKAEAGSRGEASGLAEVTKLSLAVQLGSRALGFVANLLLVRWFSPELVGAFALVTGTAQVLSTLARLGTDYSFQVEAGRLAAAERPALQRTFLLFNLLTSLLASALALPGLQQALGPTAGPAPLGLVLLAYLVLESYVDVLWEPVLAGRHYRRVFLRHLQVAAWRGGLTLGLGLWLGWPGLLLGLLLATVVNVAQALAALAGSGGGPLRGDLLRVLLREGLPVYWVPLAQQLVFWLLLLQLGAAGGLARVGLVKVAQLVVQVVGLLPGALAPILRVECALDGEGRRPALQRGLGLVMGSGLLVFAGYSLVDTWLLPALFGPAYAAARQPARALVLAAVCSGTSQLFLQQALRGRELRLVSALQVLPVLLLAPLGWGWLLPRQGAAGYAVLQLLVALMTLIALTLQDRRGLLRSPALRLPWLALLPALPLALAGAGLPVGPAALLALASGGLAALALAQGRRP